MNAAPTDAPLEQAKTLFFSGLQAQQQGRFDTAEIFYRQALALVPDRLSIANNLAVVLHHQGKFAEAAEHCTQLLQTHPGDAELHVNRGNALLGLHQLREALASFETALALHPGHVDALINRANAYESLGQPLSALGDLDQVLKLAPGHVDALNNRGNVLTDLGRAREALADYQHARLGNPDAPLACWNEALCRLYLGEFESGWRLYEQGWGAGLRSGPKPAFSQPEWDGRQLQGTLLVWGEQGIGDQILFSSMLGDLQRKTPRLLIAADARLEPLCARSFPDIPFINLQQLPAAGFDQQIAMGSLGRHLRNHLDNFPANRGAYLQADTRRAQALRVRLGAGDKLICGFSWASTNPQTGGFKSLNDADLSALAALPGVRWVSLQYGDTRSDLERFRRDYGLDITTVEDIDNFHDMDGLAALIKACDLVISVSNTTVHLAGALDVPTLVMLPHAIGRIWYWHQLHETSPWYPSCRLIRQQSAGAWPDVIANVATIIREYATRKRKN